MPLHFSTRPSEAAAAYTDLSIPALPNHTLSHIYTQPVFLHFTVYAFKIIFRDETLNPFVVNPNLYFTSHKSIDCANNGPRTCSSCQLAGLFLMFSTWRAKQHPKGVPTPIDLQMTGWTWVNSTLVHPSVWKSLTLADNLYIYCLKILLCPPAISLTLNEWNLTPRNVLSTVRGQQKWSNVNW